MHQNKIWIVILAVMAAITLWFGGKALHGIYTYLRVDQTAAAHLESWSVEQIGSDRFVLRAAYTFQVGEHLYTGEGTIPKLVFRNRGAARRKMAQLQNQEQTVWYRSKNPQVSRLGRVFPYKQTIYAAIILGVLFYFVVLGRLAASDRGDVPG